ncbi:phospholipase A1 member A-like isoform X2 [Artemia franciscana]|uniref:phospholipase A1 member A-like isoform X2 n=1 Tax=Artemia franciscana TaxID=6661 RepID=UPI0032D9E741
MRKMAWYDVAGVALGVIGSMLQLWIITLQTGNSPHTEFLLFPGSDGLFQLAIYDNEEYRVPFHPTQDVKFLLYTPSNRKEAFRIFVNNVKILRTSPFMPNISVRIFIHGFGMSTRLGKFAKEIVKTFMAEDADHCNLIHVDWEKSAMAPLYNTAAANSKEVGYELSKLVHFLVSNGANLSTVHIVGFSMGAHVAGFAAKHFKKNYGQMLPRVTAACSHMRSWKYFLESVASAKKFLAVPCPDYPSFKAGLCGDCDKTKSNCSMALPMGFWTPPTARGNFYLLTKGRRPYSYT